MPNQTDDSFEIENDDKTDAPSIGVLRGGAKGALPHPPPLKLVKVQ